MMGARGGRCRPGVRNARNAPIIRALAEGQCDLTLGPAKPARLGVVPTALGLFAGGDKVGSLALIRLSLWSPAREGILAFGAEDAESVLH